MSGIQQALLTHGATYRVTIGVSSSIAGYNDGTNAAAFGSIQPSTGMFKGVVIYRIATSESDDLFIWLSGSLSQDYFKGVTIEDGTGALRTYLTADATFIGAWIWGTGSNRVWNTTDSGEVRTVSFF